MLRYPAVRQQVRTAEARAVSGGCTRVGVRVRVRVMKCTLALSILKSLNTVPTVTKPVDHRARI